MRPLATPSQTVGPYFRIGLVWDQGPVADPAGVALGGLVLDGEGPVRDALVEAWLPRPAAFARSETDDDGAWRVRLPHPAPIGGQAPHVALTVFARGLLHHLVTRAYLSDETEANAADPVLSRVSTSRRATLVAQDTDDGYRFDITLQGPGETAFFDL